MAETDSIPLPYRAKDLTGQKFGRLLVLRYVGTNKRSDAMWRCKCDCGKDYTVPTRRLRFGHTRSCGCLNRDITVARCTIHGMHGSREYRSWLTMISRCGNPNVPSYQDYGARGITVCQRWQDSFEAFVADMGPRPDGYTLDRIENDSGYEKSNCRWATRKEQARNSRRNRFLTFRGETKLLIAWAEELGIHYSTLSYRIYQGWSVERALTQPVRHVHGFRTTPSESQGTFSSVPFVDPCDA